MPKGQKQIEWTAENDARLILTILAVENVHPNCEKVAAAFGRSVNAMAISNRLSRLRRKAAEEGLVAKGGAAAPAKGGKGDGVGIGIKGSKGWKKGGTTAEASKTEDPASDEHEAFDSPSARKMAGKGHKVLSGRVTKARIPAKKDAKRDAQVLDGAEFEAGYDGRGAAEGVGGEEDLRDVEEVHDGEDVAVQIKEKDD